MTIEVKYVNLAKKYANPFQLSFKFECLQMQTGLLTS